ncbi:MAG: alpha/beta hydrolase [Sphingobacteriales bacterium]|nr:MAG: alpha/beta hydrolase [Sphingobacteriales bacterium]
MRIYFISGLGADRRVFGRLKFSKDIEVVHIDWIPAREEESLEAYSHRMLEFIDTSVPFSLLGLSMGGMVAVEISKLKRPQHLFLVSSAACASDLPELYRRFGSAGLLKLVPARLMVWPHPAVYWYFGARDEADRKLVRDIMKDTDPAFVKWAVGAILSWRNSLVPVRPLRIHGGSDKVLPPCKDTDVLVDGAGHLMVWTHAEAVVKAVEGCLG